MSARTCSELIFCQGTVCFCEFIQTRNKDIRIKDSLKKNLCVVVRACSRHALTTRTMRLVPKLLHVLIFESRCSTLESGLRGNSRKGRCNRSDSEITGQCRCWRGMSVSLLCRHCCVNVILPSLHRRCAKI